MAKVVFDEGDYVNMSFFDKQDQEGTGPFNPNGHKFNKKEEKLANEAWQNLLAFNFADFFNFAVPKGPKAAFIKKYFLGAIEDELKGGFAVLVLNEAWQIKNRFGEGKNEKSADILRGRGAIDLLVLVSINKLMEKTGITKYLEDTYEDKDWTRADIEIYTTSILAGILSGVRVGVVGGMAFGPGGVAAGAGYGAFMIYATYTKLKQYQKNLEGKGKEFKLIEALDDIYGYMGWMIPEDEFNMNKNMGEVRKGEILLENLEEKFQTSNSDSGGTFTDPKMEEEFIKYEKVRVEEERIKKIINMIKRGEDLYDGLGRIELLRLKEEWNNLEFHIDTNFDKQINPNTRVIHEEDIYVYYEQKMEKERELNKDMNEIELEEIIVNELQNDTTNYKIE